MKTLEELYATIKNLQDSNIPIEGATRKKLEEIEENLIKEEIFPLLSEAIEPLLKDFQRDLVFVVKYQPNSSISINFPDKINTKESYENNLDTKPAVTTQKKYEEKVNNSSWKGLRVTFPDGTVICNSRAIDTFVNTIKKIGFEKVANINIKRAGHNLVSKEKCTTKSYNCQVECDGWYIWSCLSNEDKNWHLETISNYYQLNLKIEKR